MVFKVRQTKLQKVHLKCLNSNEDSALYLHSLRLCLPDYPLQGIIGSVSKEMTFSCVVLVFTNKKRGFFDALYSGCV